MNTGVMLPSALLILFLQATVTSSAGTMTKPIYSTAKKLIVGIATGVSVPLSK